MMVKSDLIETEEHLSSFFFLGAEDVVGEGS